MQLKEFALQNKVTPESLYNFLKRFPVFESHVTTEEIDPTGLTLLYYLGTQGFNDIRETMKARDRYLSSPSALKLAIEAAT